MLYALSDWLYGTSLSQTIQSTPWIIPLVQTVHILAIALLTGSALLLNLRLTGVLAVRESHAAVYNRYAPWLKWAVAVLAASGLLLIIGEPERVLFNWAFWTKMALVVLGLVLLFIAGRSIRQTGDAEPQPAFLRPLGLVAILVWIFVIMCGRWIAYAVG